MNVKSGKNVGWGEGENERIKESNMTYQIKTQLSPSLSLILFYDIFPFLSQNEASGYVLDFTDKSMKMIP